MIPTIGRIVQFTLAACHVDAIKDQRARSEGRLVGNPVSEGMVFPLVITQTWGSQPHSAFNGQLQLDGNDTLWLTSVSFAPEPKIGFAHRPQLQCPEGSAARGNLPPHQQRVVEEKAQLDDRLQKLGTFIKESPIYPTLADAERERLVRQESCMAEYSAILAERIGAFA